MAIESRFELDPDELARKVSRPAAAPRPEPPAPRPAPRPEPAPARPLVRPEPAPSRPVARHPAPNQAPAPRAKRADRGDSYTVRPGDNIFKILMREYGLSNDEAEALVPEVKRLNGMEDIRSLQVGSRIRLPRRGNVTRAAAGRLSPAPADPQTPSHVMHLSASPAAAASGGGDGMEPVQRAWEQLVPSAAGTAAPALDVAGRNFSLSVDPARFPVLAAADGGKIVVDAQGSLPPLVKSLLQDSDATVRVVTEKPANRHRFFAALLAAARFYSVEENFSVSFGADPQVTVNSDFKIEKHPDSVLRQDVVLLNTVDGQRGMPESLVRFLKGEGFSVVDAALPAGGVARGTGTVCRVTERHPRGMADQLLGALAIPFEKDRPIAVFDQKDAGFTLNVKADRYFEDGGRQYVLSSFGNDPVNYTLMRLLETRGYRIILLDEADSFKSVAEKVLGRLLIPGTYGKQSLWPSQDVPFNVSMSGIMLHDRRNPGAGLFVTDREVTPLVRDLMDFKGISVQGN